MKIKVGDKVIFKKGDWLDHIFIDNCQGTVRNIDDNGDYHIDWNICDTITTDIYQKEYVKDYLHIDIKQIRKDKLKELGIW